MNSKTVLYTCDTYQYNNSNCETGPKNEGKGKRQENGKPKSKPISEKRRLQNRQSQKTFREKHRRQKQLLKRVGGSRNLRPLAASPISPSSWSHSSSSIQSSEATDAAITPLSTAHGENSGMFIPSENLYHKPNHSFDDLCYLSPYEDQYMHVSPQYLTPRPSLPNIMSPEYWNLSPWADHAKADRSNVPIVENDQYGDCGDSLSRLLMQADDKLDQYVVEQILQRKLNVYDVLNAVLNSLSQLAPTGGSRDQDLSPWCDGTGDCSLQQSRLQRRNVPSCPTETQFCFPTAQVAGFQNRLSLICMSFYEASKINATMLNMAGASMDSRGDAVGPLSASTPESRSNGGMMSPFFQPGISKETAEEICSVNFANVKPFLRPVPSQIMKSHYSYMDTIPFPSFRERAIGMICTNPPMIDEEELFQDLLHDGLICWASDPTKASCFETSSAPWDLRSWEAQPWFLKKWWILVGGTQSEIYRQTVWWREMRGETILDLFPSIDMDSLH
ncbi:conserved hypothetical protein [Paecilomyces variotii No. 5]|uniref:BZIP domain-containing protein n=1 Tax=Byssochlamys spectabilis (strain No. 5 / NBRC 109023) TaxID=1356009 RepID=V5G652_BYSSN|nr:conserved hypothetical protein [Paecilomyces variotii No. 5]